MKREAIRSRKRRPSKSVAHEIQRRHAGHGAAGAAVGLQTLLVLPREARAGELAQLLGEHWGANAALLIAHSPAEAYARLSEQPVDVVLVDGASGDATTGEVFAELQRRWPATARLAIVDARNPQQAAEMARLGAQDCLGRKGLSRAVLTHAVERAQSAAVLEAEQRRALHELQHVKSEMDHLVRALSHDLGASLMMLESGLKQLRRAPAETVDVAREDALAHVDACLRESRHFLADLVTLGRTGRIDMEPAHVELTGLVDEVLFEQQDLLVERGVHVHRPADLPAVWCNAHRVKQVLTNLVRNSARHGRGKRSPELWIEAVAESATSPTGGATDWVRLVVRDNGPGIPCKFREQIFLPGARLAHADPEGSGMGLAIARKIVEYYGGTMGVDEAPGGGAAFWFTLPSAQG